jgi:SAM-dependent methyltransferase
VSLRNGERQVAPDVSGIRRDHVARYEFVAARLPKGSRVLDLACGVGYGSQILAKAGHHVLGVDASPDAIAYARSTYLHPNVEYLCASAEDLHVDEIGTFDALVSFETIEHLSEPGYVLKHWSNYCKTLFASVPNETIFPHQGKIRFHYRHYTRKDFAALLSYNGWQVDEWHGQAGPVSEVEPEIEGRTLIAVARSMRKAKPETTNEARVKSVPEHVAIVGLGPSCATYFELTRRLGGVSAYCDETWGINAIGDVLRCDRVFHMDDIRVQEARAKEKPDSNIAAMVKWLKSHPGPVYTSIPRPGYPGMVAFPLEDVLNGNLDGNGGAPYFNSTAAYAVAYAIHIGVKRISLFGVDYTMPNAHKAEQGRACVEFWLGIAAARGIEITVPDQSSLLDACAPEAERLYGYDCADVFLDPREDGGVKIRLEEKAPPSAAEIEHRYDHSRHPNRLMEAAE